MKGILSTLAIVWRIASPYFRSEDRWPGRILLAAVIVGAMALYFGLLRAMGIHPRQFARRG